MLTTVASSTTMNWARQAMTRTNQGLTLRGALSAGSVIAVALMRTPGAER